MMSIEEAPNRQRRHRAMKKVVRRPRTGAPWCVVLATGCSSCSRLKRTRRMIMIIMRQVHHPASSRACYRRSSNVATSRFSRGIGLLLPTSGRHCRHGSHTASLRCAVACQFSKYGGRRLVEVKWEDGWITSALPSPQVFSLIGSTPDFKHADKHWNRGSGDNGKSLTQTATSYAGHPVGSPRQAPAVAPRRRRSR